MKYNEFKHRVYDVIKQYGFKKENKEYVYRNDEMKVIFGLEKSVNGNFLVRYGLGICPFDILENWNLEEPTYYDMCQIGIPFYDIMNISRIELDNITEEQVLELTKQLEEFLQNGFSKYTSVKSLKNMVKSKELEVSDYICEFWGVNIQAVVLNYDVVYFGRGMQIARMMVAYFGTGIRYIDKEPIFPLKPKESDVVGIKLKFEIYNDFEVDVDILDDMNFEIRSKLDNKVYKTGLVDCDLWTFAKALEFRYDIRDEAVKERIEILAKALKNLHNGQNIEIVDIKA